MTDRCPTCDREECPTMTPTEHTEDGRDTCPGCVAMRDCSAHAVDWRARAIAAEAERSEILALVNPSSDQSLPDAVRELCEYVEELSGRIATVAASIEHDVAVKRSHDDARATGGQTVGTGGPLTPAPQSVLRYLDLVVRDLHDERTRSVADALARWAKVEPLIERLRKADASFSSNDSTCDAIDALLAATEATP